MYEVERTESEIIVKGPDNYVKALNPESISIVLRPSVHCPFADLEPYALRYVDMTDSEIVGQTLGISSYPV